MDLREAVERLESNLAEDYPGEFLDVEALRVVLDHVRGLLSSEDGPRGDAALVGPHDRGEPTHLPHAVWPLR